MAIGRSSGSSKESLIQHPFTGGSWPKTMVRSMNSIGRQYPLVPGTIFHREHEWNTIRYTTPPMYSTLTGIRSRSSIKASGGTSHRQGTYSTERFDPEGNLTDEATKDLIIQLLQNLVDWTRRIQQP
jgi:hypothetical protein